MIENFKKEVLEGLSASPKYLSSKYFYDEKGDALFQQIMRMPEYYLTDCEFEIFSEQRSAIVEAFQLDKTQPFELIELGAGDGIKTVQLLSHLMSENYNFEYLPIDISQNALSKLESSLSKKLKGIKVKGQQGEYFQILEDLISSSCPKVILFIGSNIGNLTDDQATAFIGEMASKLKAGDKLLLGVDLIKKEDIILPAYNDKAGITRAFNLNLLSRINRELGGTFDVSRFDHCPSYDSSTGLTRSFLKSTTQQDVYIESLDQTFSFALGELIQTETSRKYNDQILSKIIQTTRFEITHKFTDRRQYFTDYLLTIR